MNTEEAEPTQSSPEEECLSLWTFLGGRSSGRMTHGNFLAQENTHHTQPQVASDCLSFGDRANLLILSRKDKEHSYHSPAHRSGKARDLNSTCMVALP